MLHGLPDRDSVWQFLGGLQVCRPRHGAHAAQHIFSLAFRGGGFGDLFAFVTHRAAGFSGLAVQFYSVYWFLKFFNWCLTLLIINTVRACIITSVLESS